MLDILFSLLGFFKNSETPLHWFYLWAMIIGSVQLILSLISVLAFLRKHLGGRSADDIT